LCALGALARLAEAQSFSFDSVDVPGALQLRTYYTFFVYSAQDAPDRSLGAATVTARVALMADLDAPSPAPTSQILAYRSLQVALLPESDFWGLVDPRQFCGYDAQSTPRLTLRHENTGVFVHSVLADVEGSLEATLNETGAYVLALCNCGNLTGLKVGGSIKVRNPHGHLSGTDYGKIAFYASLAVLYLITSLVWTALVALRRDTVGDVQKGILVVSCAGVVEACLMWWLYSHWNGSGEFLRALYLAGSVVSIWKLCVAFRTALAGAEVLRESQEGPTADWKVSVALVLYAAAEFKFRSALRFRAAYALQAQDVLVDGIPAILVGGALLSWAIYVLIGDAHGLKAVGSDEKAMLLYRSILILVLVSVGLLLAFILQLLDFSSNMWRLHSLLSDGPFHAIFLLALCATMAVWRPSEATRQASLAPSIDKEDEEERQPIGKAMDG